MGYEVDNGPERNKRGSKGTREARKDLSGQEREHDGEGSRDDKISMDSRYILDFRC